MGSRFGAIALALVGLAAGGSAACATPTIGEEPTGLSEPSSNATSDASADVRHSATGTAHSAFSESVDAGSDATTTMSATLSCSEAGAVQAAGHCYFGLSTPSTWDAALTACASAGAHLATLNSAAEQSAAATILATDERWIGLRRPIGSTLKDASYAWVTGEPRGFQNWSVTQSEPDGSCPTCTVAGSAECGRLLASGQWADDLCTAAHPFLCERD